MNRQFQLAIKQKTATANNLIALQEQSFPGIRKLFDSPVRGDGTQKWVDFTHDFWHVDCVRSGSLNAFTERYRKWCKRNRYQFSTEKACQGIRSGKVRCCTGAENLCHENARSGRC